MFVRSLHSTRSIGSLLQKRYNEVPNGCWSIITTPRVGGFGKSRNSNHVGSRYCSSSFVSQRHVRNGSSTYSHINNKPFISKSNTCRRYLTTSTTNAASSNISRPDPFARRPNQKCDPYGQGGKPLSMEDAQNLLSTVDKEWKLDVPSQEENNDEAKESSITTLKSGGGVDETSSSSKDVGDDDSSYKNRTIILPKSISREFYHTEFIDGSKFVSKIAALAQMNNHYPTITLHRKVLKKQKQWISVTKITCHTNVLNGLSYNDFHLAMVRLVSSCVNVKVLFCCMVGWNNISFNVDFFTSVSLLVYSLISQNQYF